MRSKSLLASLLQNIHKNLNSNDNFQSVLALSENRSEEERNGIVDELFARYAERVAESPADHGMDYVHAYMVIKKD